MFLSDDGFGGYGMVPMQFLKLLIVTLIMTQKVFTFTVKLSTLLYLRRPIPVNDISDVSPWPWPGGLVLGFFLGVLN